MYPAQPQYQEVDVAPYGYEQGQPLPQPAQYDRDFDQIESYGSIIKEITDTEAFLKAYELRLVGKVEDDSGNMVRDKSITPMINNDQTAKEFVDMIRSIANQNTHFTWFNNADILNSLNAMNYTMNRWLMFQRDIIPLRYRQKLAFEAMNIAKASLHKAKDRTLLGWSKGNIKEGQQITQGGGGMQQKRGLMDMLFHRRR